MIGMVIKMNSFLLLVSSCIYRLWNIFKKIPIEMHCPLFESHSILYLEAFKFVFTTNDAATVIRRNKYTDNEIDQVC
jgi:hypothetical protein